MTIVNSKIDKSNDLELGITNANNESNESNSIKLQPGLVLEARVRVVVGSKLLVEVAEKHVWATLALAYCYQPTANDRVLVLGSSESWYVVGVLQSSSNQTLRIQGDFTVQAEGRIRLDSKEAIYLNSSSIGLKASSLICIANVLNEKYQSVNRTVKYELIERLGKIKSTVESVYRLKANRIVQRADKDVSIDGNKINLG